MPHPPQLFRSEDMSVQVPKQVSSGHPQGVVGSGQSVRGGGQVVFVLHAIAYSTVQSVIFVASTWSPLQYVTASSMS